MKRIIKYIIIFIITLVILCGLLVVTAKIPKELISENIKESTNAFKTNSEIERVVINRDYTYKHIYADAMILNIIYCIDSDTPMKSVMEARYYSKYKSDFIDYNDNEESIYEKINNKKISYDFNELVENNYEGNVQYMRYWHGSMSILRPLLVLFNLEQIYIINLIVLSILTIILLILLIKTKIKELVVAFIIALIMCAVIIVPSCLEYSWTYMIMLIASIGVIILDKKGKKVDVLFFVTGMVTCYLDFLSTEILTAVIPILIILVIKYKDGRITRFREGFKILLHSIMLWGIAYAGMWFAKWILASIILNINAFEYVIDEALLRINGANDLTTIENLQLNAIKKNLFTLYPINLEKSLTDIIPIIILIFEIIFIRKKDFQKLWFSALLLLIAIIPYIRYMVLANHSYNHYFFTFRSQMISIIAIILAIVYSIDKNIVKYKINMKNRRKNGINDINTMLK